MNWTVTELRTIGTAITDEEGHYQLPVAREYAGGPVLIKLSARSGGSTLMVCDISEGCDNDVKFGETLTLGNAFEIESILPEVEKGAVIKAHITPFTHMAAKRVLAGSVNPESITKAYSEVSQIVGIDVLKTEPIDITKTAEGSAVTNDQHAYSAFLAAAGKLAVKDPGGLEAGLIKLADTFKDGKFDAEDDFSIGDLIKATKEEAEASKIDAPELDKIISTIKAQVDENGNFDPKPSPTATALPVEKAKALVGDIRTWVNSVNELNDPAKAFDVDVEAAAKVLNSNSTVLAEMTINIVTSIFEEFQSIVSRHDRTLELGKHTIEMTNRQGEIVGNIEVELLDDNGIKMMISEQTLEDITFDFSLATDIPKKALDEESFDLQTAQISASGTIESNNDVSITLNGVDLKVVFEQPVTVNSPSKATMSRDIKLATFAGHATVKADNASFSGHASMKFVDLTEQPVISNYKTGYRDFYKYYNFLSKLGVIMSNFMIFPQRLIQR